MYRLNPTAWLILELCDGGSREAIGRAFGRAIGARLAPEAARASLADGLATLERFGLIVEGALAPTEA